MYSSAIVFVVCARRKNRRNSKLECRRSARQDLYRPPRLPSAACGWRLGTVAVWRRLQCAVGQRNGRQTSGNAGCCRRDARRERESASRSFARSFTGRILYNLFGMDLSECNAHAFSAASQTRFCERRTVRSQLRVARAEERGGRSRWQDRHGLYVETAVCFERLRRKRRRGDVLRGVTHVGLRSCRCP